MIDNEKNYVELPVTDGHVTKVNPEMVEKIGKKRIFLWGGSTKYPAIRIGLKNIKLHRLVLDAKAGQFVDHIDGDVFNNTKKNLRFCTLSQNGKNRHYPFQSKSGFLGVYKRNKKFRACIHVDYKYKHIEYFNESVIAALFRDNLSKKLSGKFAGLNFPNIINESNLYDFLISTNGKLFVCWFVKRCDGSVRKILCRSGVKKNLKDKGLCYDPKKKNLFLVYDFSKKNYRFIPLENILCIRFQTKNYRVIRERQLIAA